MPFHSSVQLCGERVPRRWRNETLKAIYQARCRARQKTIKHRAKRFIILHARTQLCVLPLCSLFSLCFFHRGSETSKHAWMLLKRRNDSDEIFQIQSRRKWIEQVSRGN